MAKEPIETRVGRAVSASKPGAEYEEAVRSLGSICKSLARSLNPRPESGRAGVFLLPGFQATMGQQLNVVVEIPRVNFRDTLFRAYVPLAGFPVQLDFYGEEPVRAETVEAMEDAIVDFLGKPEVSARLNTYRSLIEGPPPLSER